MASLNKKTSDMEKKTSPLDTDYIGLADPLARWSFAITWKNIKNTLKTWVLGRTVVTVGFGEACDYVCDGTADDVQIQAAINSLSTSKGKVLILRGTYQITAPISLTFGGIVIEGEGQATVLNNIQAGGAHCFTSSYGSNGSISDTHIRNLKITQGASSGDALHLEGFNVNSTVEDVWIDGGTRGVYAIDCWTSYFKNIYVTNTSYGFYFDNGANKQVTMVNLTASTCSTAGLYSNGGDGWEVIGFDATFCGYGILQDYGTSMRFVTPYFEGNVTADYYRRNGDATQGNVEISGGDHNNTIHTPTGYIVSKGNIRIIRPSFYSGNTYANYIQVDNTVASCYIDIDTVWASGILNNAAAATTIVSGVTTDHLRAGTDLKVKNTTWTSNGNDILLNAGATAQTVTLRPNGDGSAVSELKVDANTNTLYFFNTAGSSAVLTVTGTGLGTLTAGLVTPKVSPISDSTTAFKITKADGSTSVMTVNTTAGYVGIGLTPTYSNLVVSGNLSLAANSGVLNFIDPTQSTRYGYINHDGTNMWINNQITGSLFLQTNNATKFTLDSSGNRIVNGYENITAISTPSASAASTLNLYTMTTQGHTRPAYLDDDGIEIVIARDNFIVAKNTTGGTINKGQAVYVTGSTGNVPNIGLAKADSSTTLPAVGLAMSNISPNAFGYIQLLGVISSIDTSAFTTGDKLFVSATTAGAITNVSPTYPNFVQRVGSVLVSGVGNGSIDVAIAPYVGGLSTGTTQSYTVGGSLTTVGDITDGNLKSKTVIGTDANGKLIDASSATLTNNTSGNAATATKLAVARTINGASFDGSANVVIHARTNTVTTSATPSINTDTTDIFTITALSDNITSFTTNLTGTPSNGDKLLIRILDAGVAKTIAWGTSFASRGATLPTTTVASKYLYVGLIWNSTASVWDCVTVCQE